MTERYITTAGGGLHDGSSEANAWTLAEAVAEINTPTGDWADGDRANIKADGTYTTAGFIITNAGGVAVSHFRGYTSGITDGGQATIQRSGGATHFLQFPDYWRIENLIIDGQDSGSDNLYLSGATNTLAVNIETHSAGRYGITHSAWGENFNCYAHDNASHGFYGGVNKNCLSYNNGGDGFYNFDHVINCISKDNDGNYGFECIGYRQTSVNCISDGDQRGWKLLPKCTITNSVIKDPVFYGINLVSGLGVYIENINFDNCPTKTSNDGTYESWLGTNYELDSQFVSPATFDYRRNGTNLEAKGFSTVGIQAFDYRLPIGIFAQEATDYPALGDVQDGVVYGLGTGTLELPAVADVRDAVFYGEDGTEFEGTLDVPSADGIDGNVNFKLYDSTGNNLLLTLPVIQDSNHPYTSSKVSEISSQRGKGSIIINGGEESWDLVIRGVVSGADYEALAINKNSLETIMALNTRFVMKIDRTSTTTDDYNVKRFLPIQWGKTNYRNTFQEFTVTLRANSW